MIRFIIRTMKNHLTLSRLICLLSTTIFSISFIEANAIPIKREAAFLKRTYFSNDLPSTVSAKEFYTDAEAECIYEVAELAKTGLSIQAFKYGYYGYRELLKAKKINNSDYLTICDFSQSSSQRRLYIIDIERHELVTQTFVAHGRNSGIEFAKNFSNNPRSHQSSLGFYITGQTYSGGYGLSLQLNGIEKGFNDRALNRRIVLHGSKYVGDEYLQRRRLLGRSYGCPAVPKDESGVIINFIKNGSCLFIFYPAKNYLDKSKILNS